MDPFPHDPAIRTPVERDAGSPIPSVLAEKGSASDKDLYNDHHVRVSPYMPQLSQAFRSRPSGSARSSTTAWPVSCADDLRPGRSMPRVAGHGRATLPDDGVDTDVA